ncbi:MAG: hypothetical protein ACI9AB_002044 [Urechidicola sp.]|jgi:hypothetical protein
MFKLRLFHGCYEIRLAIAASAPYHRTVACKPIDISICKIELNNKTGFWRLKMGRLRDNINFTRLSITKYYYINIKLKLNIVRKFSFVFYLILFIPFLANTQSVEITGSLKVSTAVTDNTAAFVVVRLTDGTFAVRDASSFGAVIPAGVAFGEFLYWDGTQWVIGSTEVKIGSSAGENSQGPNAIAIGNGAGFGDQGSTSIAIGLDAGANSQGLNAVAIGNGAGFGDQGFTSIAIGRDAGQEFQSPEAVAIGNRAGSGNQGFASIAIGKDAGITNQSYDAVAIGIGAGSDNQGSTSIAIGRDAGEYGQSPDAVAIGNRAGSDNQGFTSIAIGRDAGEFGQSPDAVAIGNRAGSDNQGFTSIAIGLDAGETNQSFDAVAIGNGAGLDNQGTAAVAIGAGAGNTAQHDNSIIINASGNNLNSSGSDGLFIKPIRGVPHGLGEGVLHYDPTTGEITYSTN